MLRAPPHGCKTVEFDACCIIAAETRTSTMAAISETLRQARLRSGVDLNLLAAKTKINPRYLQAIESGEFDKLPGGVFARMFIKQYADAVGLDGASFAEEFQRQTPTFGYAPPDVQKIASTRVNFQPTVPGFSSGAHTERMTNMLSSLIWVVAAILVCAGAYYGLAHLPSRPQQTAVQTPPKMKPPVPVQQPAVQHPPDASASGSPSPVTVPPATAPAASPAPVPTAAEPIQIALNATDEVWVTAIADGKTVISEALKPGTTKVVSAAKGARLTLGNAGGVDITFNGKKLEPFGPKGQVRTIDFTSFGAQVVSRTPPPSSALPVANPDPLR
jgi:cytoskeletal protein RodZ